MAAPFVGDIGQAAANQFGVDLSLGTDLITVDRVPRTRTRTSHGLTIRVGGGRIIGAVNALGHSTSRQVDDEWEIDRNAVGTAPADLVPQNVTGRQLQVSRYDLFVRSMEEALNKTGEVVVLSDQFRPFTLRTTWQSPVGIALGGRRIYEYQDCWFSDLGRTVRTDDNRIVNVDATITYRLRRRVL